MPRQRRPRARDKAYLAAIAELPSVISLRSPVQVCHLRYADPARGKPHTGVGEKPDDFWTLPLTPGEHILQHSMSERAFWKMNGIDPVALCLRLRAAWQAAPDLTTAVNNMRREIVMARCLTPSIDEH